MNTSAIVFAFNEEAGAILFFLILFLLGLPFVWLSSWRKKRRKEREEVAALRAKTARRERAESELRNARLAGEINPVEDALPVMLEKDETAYWCEPSALTETRTERSFAGFTTDWQALEAFSLGTVHAKEKTKDVWKQIDAGHLVVTDRRILFVGSAEQRTIPFDRVVSIQGSPEAIVVGASGLAKKMFFSSRNGLLAEWTAKNLIAAAKG